MARLSEKQQAGLAALDVEGMAAYLRSYPAEYRENLTEDLDAFLAAVDASTYDAEGAQYQGEAGSIERMLSVEPSMQAAFISWLANRIADRKRAAQAAWNAAHPIEAAAWSAKGLAKAKRLTREEADAWIKQGTAVRDDSPELHGRGWDSDFGATFKVRALRIGTELPEGTITARRMVHDIEDGRGWRTQYLVKPRSKSAQATYERQQRIAELERSLRIDVEMLPPEQIEAIRAELARLRP